MRLYLAVIVLVVANSGAQLLKDYKGVNLGDLYREIKKKDGGELLKSSSPEQDQIRIGILKKSVDFVIEHNKDDGDEWTAGYNEFSCETEAEKNKVLGTNVTSLVMAEVRAAELETPFSFVKRGIYKRQASTVNYSAKLPAIKNQGSCGSCWTFGAAAALEYQVNRKSTTVKSLSEEQLLDCTYESKAGYNGCNGGWPTACYDWIKKEGSYITSNAAYPYAGGDGACDTSKPNAITGFTVAGTKYLGGSGTSGKEANLYAAVGNSDIGVISVAIGVYSPFFTYRTGVYADNSCSGQNLNHAVDVVGYGSNYYRVRNSWGSSWGDGGYINMKRGVNLCQIADYGHYPVVTGEGEDENEDVDPTDDDSKKVCKTWKKVVDTKYKKALSKPIHDIDEAKAMCEKEKKCVGISCKNAKKCCMNGKAKGKKNTKFDAYKCIT